MTHKTQIASVLFIKFFRIPLFVRKYIGRKWPFTGDLTTWQPQSFAFVCVSYPDLLICSSHSFLIVTTWQKGTTTTSRFYAVIKYFDDLMIWWFHNLNSNGRGTSPQKGVTVKSWVFTMNEAGITASALSKSEIRIIISLGLYLNFAFRKY